MAFTVYKDPQNAKIGDIPIAISELILCQREGQTSGAISFSGPDTASRAAGKAGTLSFTWHNRKTNADETVTLPGVTIGGYDVTLADKLDGITLPFVGGKR
jgi:hypothetical protein